MSDHDSAALFALRPGSPDAKAAGCICKAARNPKGSLGKWIQAGCPIHYPMPADKPKN
jgi:hypothetical protein